MAAVPVLRAVPEALADPEVLALQEDQVHPADRAAALAPRIRAVRRDLAAEVRSAPAVVRSGPEAAVVFRVGEDLAADLVEAGPVAAATDLSPR
jgi:hypothetical protein